MDITYPFFSTPMNAASFGANIRETLRLKEKKAEEGAAMMMMTISPEKPLRLARLLSRAPQPVPSWSVSSVAPDICQIGPWFVDVRHGVQGTVRLTYY